MAETVTITCPECGKVIRGPDEILGKRIKCKECGGVFVARADRPPAGPPKGAVAKGPPPKGKPPKPKPPADLPIPLKDDDEGDDDGRAYGVTTEDLTPRCPECANEMGPDDVVCLHCGFNTRTRTRVERRRVRALTGGQHFLWLLPGIACLVLALVTVPWALSNLISYLVWGVPEDFYKDAGESAQLYKNVWCCCSMWWFVILAYTSYASIRFAIKRLILHNKPPEVEEK